MAEALPGVQHAGVVDEQVEPAGYAVGVFPEHQRQLVQQVGAGFRLRHVQRQYMQAARMRPGQPVQRSGLARVAAGGDHVLATRQQLADEFQADAAVGAGDQAVATHAGSSARESP